MSDREIDGAADIDRNDAPSSDESDGEFEVIPPDLDYSDSSSSDESNYDPIANEETSDSGEEEEGPLQQQPTTVTERLLARHNEAVSLRARLPSPTAFLALLNDSNETEANENAEVVWNAQLERSVHDDNDESAHSHEQDNARAESLVEEEGYNYPRRLSPSRPAGPVPEHAHMSDASLQDDYENENAEHHSVRSVSPPAPADQCDENEACQDKAAQSLKWVESKWNVETGWLQNTETAEVEGSLPEQDNACNEGEKHVDTEEDNHPRRLSPLRPAGPERAHMSTERLEEDHENDDALDCPLESPSPPADPAPEGEYDEYETEYPPPEMQWPQIDGGFQLKTDREEGDEEKKIEGREEEIDEKFAALCHGVGPLYREDEYYDSEEDCYYYRGMSQSPAMRDYARAYSDDERRAVQEEEHEEKKEEGEEESTDNNCDEKQGSSERREGSEEETAEERRSRMEQCYAVSGLWKKRQEAAMALKIAQELRFGDGPRDPRGLNPNANEYVPVVLRAGPMNATFELEDFDGVGTMHACIHPYQNWKIAIECPELRELIMNLYPTLLPLQKIAIPFIKTKYGIDIALQVQDGQGSTLSWMIVVADDCLKHWSPTPMQLPYLIFTSTQERAEVLRDELKMLMTGKKYFAVDLLDDDKNDPGNLKMEDKLIKVGLKVLITTPKQYAENFRRIAHQISVGHIIIDHMLVTPMSYFPQIYSELSERSKVKTTLICNKPMQAVFPHMRRNDGIIVKQTNGNKDKPQLDAVYVANDKEAYDKLEEVLDQYRDGTTVVFLNGYDRKVWEDIPNRLSHRSFGFLEKRMSPRERWDTLWNYRTCQYHVLIATNEMDWYLESRFRTLDVIFELPTPGRVAERLESYRNRIYSGNSLWIVDDRHFSHLRMMLSHMDSIEAESKSLEKAFCTVQEHSDAEDRRRQQKEAEEREEEQSRRHRQQDNDRQYNDRHEGCNDRQRDRPHCSYHYEGSNDRSHNGRGRDDRYAEYLSRNQENKEGHIPGYNARYEDY